MGGLVSSFGLGSGGSQGGAGTKFAADSVPLIQGATAEQANQLYGQAQTGISNELAFVNALQAQNGVQNQSDVYNQLQRIAAGQGPNPAQNMLNQATSNNIASQAALMAGQRGAGANTGLLARQAAQQGSAAQQDAAGQGATLQANQSLGAIGQAGNIAGQQVNELAGANRDYNNAVQGYQSNILGAIGQYNNANVGMRSNQNSANAQIANTVAQGQQNLLGNLAGAAGVGAQIFGSGSKPSVMTRSPFASGGEVGNPKLEESVKVPPAQDPSMPSSKVGQFMMNGGKSLMMAKGGKVPAMVSPGEIYLKPDQAKEVAKGKEDPRSGQKIKGHAKVKGDSLANDTVPKKLDAGGVVIPRSVALSGDGNKMAKFVAAALAKNGHMPKKR